MTVLLTQPPAEQALRQQPRSLGDLFLSFSWLALQGFGGVLAVAQRELVEKKRWLSREEFIEEWAVAQIMPGPNVINMAIMLGGRYFGWRGAVAAVAGMLTLPLLMILLLALLYGSVSQHPAVQGALRGMGAVAAGLITANGLKLIPGLQANVLGRAICAALGLSCLVAVAWLRLPLAAVLLGLGALGMGLAYRRLQA
ncbi:MAG: chromate transporter [Betaproteobacteria bacterium]